MLATHLTQGSIADFRASLSAKGRSSQTIRAYSADLTGLLNWIDTNHRSTTLSLETVAAMYLNNTRGSAAAKTTRRRLTTFRAYGKWSGHSILEEYHPPKPSKTQAKPMPGGMEDIRKMIQWSRTSEQKALVGLLGLCALRVSEARSIRPSNFYLEPGHETLTVRGKGDKERTIPLSDEAWEAVRPAYMEALTSNETLVLLSDSGARRAFKAIAKFCGVKASVSSHSGRATVATTILNQTGNIRVAQEFLGHASVTTTEVYTMVAMNQMRAAATL